MAGFLELIADYQVEGYTYRINEDSGNIYTLNSEYGFMVFDQLLTDDLELLGYYTNVASDFDISGDYVFLAGDGIDVADMSIYDDIHSVDEFSGTYFNDVIVQSNYAFVMDKYFGLRVLDVSNPNRIQQTGSQFWSDETYQIALKWPYLFGVYSSGIWIMDVSDPSFPWLVTDHSLLASNAIAVEDHYVYVAGETGITILDVTDIENPQEVGYYNTFSEVMDICVRSRHLFVAAGDYGVQAIDVSDPASPSLIDSYYTSGYAWSLDVDYNYIYLAQSNGITKLRYDEVY